MSPPLWLSKLSLKRSPEIGALVRTLLPEEPAEAAAADHRLVWSVFADNAERQRDFLWRREDAPGRFMALSARPPMLDSMLFEIASKPFEPVLAPGDRLGFALRFNPTVERKGAGRADVAMDRLKPLTEPGARGAAREELAAEAARTWLEARAERDGYALDTFRLDGYRAEKIGRGPRRRTGTIGVFEARGTLIVRDPAAFLARLAAGFGRAKAFGCGLMLIRRAPSSDA